MCSMTSNSVPATAITPGMETVKNCQQLQIRKVDVECPIDKGAAARILGISTDTLDQWTARYAIPHYKYDMDGNRANRGRVVYLASDILAFRDQFRVEGRNVEADVDEMLAQIVE